MNYLNKLVMIALIALADPGMTRAQALTASSNTFLYKENSLLIISDSTTKSTLLCNILADRSGSQSPLIGTGVWEEKGKNVQVSSLLYFDLSSIKGRGYNIYHPAPNFPISVPMVNPAKPSIMVKKIK